MNAIFSLGSRTKSFIELSSMTQLETISFHLLGGGERMIASNNDRIATLLEFRRREPDRKCYLLDRHLRCCIPKNQKDNADERAPL